MRTVSVLFRLGRRVLFLMAWFSSKHLNPALVRLWRRLGLLLGWIVGKVCLVIARTLLAIGWRKSPERESRDEIEISDDEELPERGGQPEVKESDREGQQEEEEEEEEEERAEGTNHELTPCEEDDDDDDVDEFDSEETADELYCCYDSTWEDEEKPQDAFRSPIRSAAYRNYKFSRFEMAARDMQNYRHGYKSQINPQRWMSPRSAMDDKPNLKFYLGQKPSIPDGVYIYDFHNEWFGKYDVLEHVHTYVQWLFPLQEPGVNYEAAPLTKEEIRDFLVDSTAKKNLLESYKLMLDFYGIELCNEETGEVRRASNWRDRFDNLNTHTHNNLRITRILKCQGTLGLAHYQVPLVRFFLQETLVNGQLPNVKESVLNYFVFAVLDKRQRRSLIKFAYFNYDRKDEFVWCPKKIQRIWSGLSHAQDLKGNELSM